METNTFFGISLSIDKFWFRIYNNYKPCLNRTTYILFLLLGWILNKVELQISAKLYRIYCNLIDFKSLKSYRLFWNGRWKHIRMLYYSLSRTCNYFLDDIVTIIFKTNYAVRDFRVDLNFVTYSSRIYF